MLGLAVGCALVRPPGPPLEPRVLLAGLEERRDSLQTLSLSGRGSLTAKGRTLRGSFTIYAARPGSLRLETYGPFGIPVLFVVAQGGQVKAVNFLERRYFFGPASAPKMAAFLPLNLSAAELIALLSAAPLPEEPTVVRAVAPNQAPRLQMAAKTGGDALVLLEGERGPVRLLFDGEARLAAASWGEGPQELVALYSDWRPCEGAAAFPFDLDFSLPSRGRALSLEASEVRLNEPAPPEAFELAPPEGFKIIEVN